MGVVKNDFPFVRIIQVVIVLFKKTNESVKIPLIASGIRIILGRIIAVAVIQVVELGNFIRA